MREGRKLQLNIKPTEFCVFRFPSFINFPGTKAKESDESSRCCVLGLTGVISLPDLPGTMREALTSSRQEPWVLDLIRSLENRLCYIITL